MFSGWGIKTLANGEVLYNPMSYHNGSVWSHDNALIVYGFSKYGLHVEVLKVMQSLFDASLFIDLQRLPELFGGFDRRRNEGPTAYPVACSPQAWAVGAVFLLLKSCLQITIDKLTITNLSLGDGNFHFEAYRHKYGVSIHLIHKPDEWELMVKK